MSVAAPIERELIEPSLTEFRQSYTLPGVAYTSQALFDWEMEQFFDASWTCLGRTEALTANAARTAVPAGTGSILLSRDEGLARAVEFLRRLVPGEPSDEPWWT